MPNQGFTIGRDIVIDVIGPRGSVRIDGITTFSAKPIYDKQKHSAMNGVTKHLNNPDGWEGDIGYDRKNGKLDDYFAAREAEYYAGKDSEVVSITETITEENGSLSQYRYTEVSLFNDNPGEKGGTALVKGKIGWNAARRLKVI